MFKFKSRASAPIIYFDADAERILAIVGKEASSQGIITVAQIPSAIAALEAAIQAEEEGRDSAQGLSESEAGQEQAQEQQSASEGGVKTVALRQRAQPFLQLLRESLSDNTDVVWGV